ncbi:hypothetical protein SASPL_114780 [Salvia splendens]|uniref:Uncharacterized protein n=1 Tax=Salvia splendens TaxID=180675 RepID=A0A8X9A110_SALSN|nr:hypothetical protein SASPL_114780 [Salvia splendens]
MGALECSSSDSHPQFGDGVARRLYSRSSCPRLSEVLIAPAVEVENSVVCPNVVATWCPLMKHAFATLSSFRGGIIRFGKWKAKLIMNA